MKQSRLLPVPFYQHSLRQRLSRIRQKMAGFLTQYCELASSEKCNCKRRIGYAIKSHRLNPSNLEYTRLEQTDNAIIMEYTQAMEKIDMQSLIFADLPKYRSPQAVKDFLKEILRSNDMKTVQAQA